MTESESPGERPKNVSHPEQDHRGRRDKRKSSKTVVALALIGGLILASLVGVLIWKSVQHKETAHDVSAFQKSLAQFYASPATPAKPGELIRTQEITDLKVPGGTAYRMIYGTQRPDGGASISSGMLIVPTGAAPESGRPVLAWAHGTLGFGDDCTPSRTYQPTLNSLDFGSWLPAAMQRGWVVAATDYAGVGTAGDPFYLVARSEAQDVINSVRAARNFPQAHAGTVYATFGHSQGGHASLSTAMFADYAPELKLVAVSGAAPAAELGALFSQQYTKPVAWGDGPSVAVSWPLVYPTLPLENVLSDSALEDYSELAHGCLLQQIDQLLIKKTFDVQFFARNPLEIPEWATAVKEQQVDISKVTVPVFIVQSLSDNVVLPNTTALLAQQACAQGSPQVSVSWLDMVTHTDTAVMGGMLAINWLQDRFSGLPATNTCDQPLPLQPASVSF